MTHIKLISRFPGLVLAVCMFVQAASTAEAEDKGNAAKPASGAEQAAATSEEGEAAEEKPQYVTFELGEFRLREYRPTRNETSKLLFAISLKLYEETSPSTVKQLENWKQRLRNETLTAVRSLKLANYQDPGLDHLQKVIRLRINRLLPVPLVERIFVTEFTVGDH